MPAAFNADERDAVRGNLGQFLTVADGNDPVTRAVNDICVALHILHPQIGAQRITDEVRYREERKKSP